MDPVLYDMAKFKSEIRQWVLLMVALAFVSAILNLVCKFSFGKVGENITMHCRQDLYQSILKKNVSWHDRSENAAGILSSVLAQDVQTLNGVSTEVLSVYMEALFAMIGGIVLSCIFSWKVALVGLAISPLMIIGGAISAKIDAANAGSDNDSNQIGKTDNK